MVRLTCTAAAGGTLQRQLSDWRGGLWRRRLRLKAVVAGRASLLRKLRLDWGIKIVSEGRGRRAIVRR